MPGQGRSCEKPRCTGIRPSRRGQRQSAASRYSSFSAANAPDRT
jgi:hypothetical protein